MRFLLLAYPAPVFPCSLILTNLADVGKAPTFGVRHPQMVLIVR